MSSVNLGERIGTLRLDGHPIAGPDYDMSRFAGARMIQEAIIEGVFEGANLMKIAVLERSKNDTPQLALYAHPPVKDAEEARRLGETLQTLLEKARAEYPGGALVPAETDTFIPPQEAAAGTSGSA